MGDPAGACVGEAVGEGVGEAVGDGVGDGVGSSGYGRGCGAGLTGDAGAPDGAGGAPGAAPGGAGGAPGAPAGGAPGAPGAPSAGFLLTASTGIGWPITGRMNSRAVCPRLRASLLSLPGTVMTRLSPSITTSDPDTPRPFTRELMICRA